MGCFFSSTQTTVEDGILYRSKSYCRNVLSFNNTSTYEKIFEYQGRAFYEKWKISLTDVVKADEAILRVIFYKLYEIHLEKTKIPRECDYGVSLQSLTKEYFDSCRESLDEALIAIGIQPKYVKDIMERQQLCERYLVKKQV